MTLVLVGCNGFYEKVIYSTDVVICSLHFRNRIVNVIEIANSLFVLITILQQYMKSHANTLIKKRYVTGLHSFLLIFLWFLYQNVSNS